MVVTLEIEGSAERTDALESCVLAFDQQGKFRDGVRNVLTLKRETETVFRARENGVRVVSRVNLTPGRHQLRIAARDPNDGRVGSVFYDVDVPDFGQPPLSLSGLLVSSKLAAGVLTVAHDGKVEAGLGGQPTTARDFTSADELTVLAEVYDNERPLTHGGISVTVSDASGRLVLSKQQGLSPELNAGRGAYAYTERIPLRDLGAGVYVLALEAQTSLPAASARREVRFRVR